MTRFMHAMLIAAACMLALVVIGSEQAPAQAPKGGDPPPVSIRFRNDTKMTLVVQGSTTVKGMERRGQPILIAPGKAVYDNNVPPGVRFIIVSDYNQPARPPLLREKLQVVPGRDLPVVIRTSPTNPNLIVLMPDQ